MNENQSNRPIDPEDENLKKHIAGEIRNHLNTADLQFAQCAFERLATLAGWPVNRNAVQRGGYCIEGALQMHSKTGEHRNVYRIIYTDDNGDMFAVFGDDYLTLNDFVGNCLMFCNRMAEVEPLLAVAQDMAEKAGEVDPSATREQILRKFIPYVPVHVGRTATVCEVTHGPNGIVDVNIGDVHAGTASPDDGTAPMSVDELADLFKSEPYVKPTGKNDN